MKEQSLNQEFSVYYNMLSDSQKESLLLMMKSFLGEIEGAKRISVKQYNKELEEAEQRIKNGQFTPHESVREESKKW